METDDEWGAASEAIDPMPSHRQRGDDIASYVIPREGQRGGEESIGGGLKMWQLCMKSYWVYMMQSANGRALYTGVTNDLVRRVGEHKEGRGSFFTAKYKCHKLVYFEEFGLIDQAIVREKEIKSLSRYDKEKLIDRINPERKDLYEQ